jgi:hypothetical protein
MNLDSFFEDLEAQIDAETTVADRPDRLDSTNLVRIYWPDGGYSELVAVLLGEDFIAGMVIGCNEWRLMQLASAARLEFCELPGLEMPTIRFFEGSRLAFLERLPLPLSITWSFAKDAQPQRGILVDLKGECLIVEVLNSVSSVGVPISRVDSLGIDSVENFDEFE